MQKNKKKKKKEKKKNFVWDVFHCDFTISDYKRAGKVSGFVFFRKGRGKM